MRTFWLRYYIYLSLFLCLSFDNYGQDIRFSTLGPEDNLSQSSVSHIIQDDQGIIWVATQIGIDRFDGRTIEPIPNLNKSLLESFTILKDSEIGIWVGIGKRLFLINKNDYESDEKKEIIFDSSIVTTNLVNIFPLKGDPHYNYLLFTENKILKINIDGSKPVSIKILSAVMEISKVVSIGKNRFVIVTKMGLYHWECRKDESENMVPLNLNVNITALYYSETDSLIYAAGRDPITFLTYKVDDIIKEFANDLKIELSKVEELNPSIISSIYIDPNVDIDKKTLWIGTRKSGLYIFDINHTVNNEVDFEGKIECHANSPEHQEISSNNITCITTSFDGVVWVGTEVGGINYWPKHRQYFDHLFERVFIGKNENGQTDSLRTQDNYALGLVSIDADNLLVGSKEGLVLLNTKNKNAFGKILPNTENDDALIISTIVQPDPLKEDIILGTNDGLYQISRNNLNSSNNYKKIISAAKDTAISILYYHKPNEEWWISNRAKNSITVLNKDYSIKNILIFPEDEKISFFQELTKDGNSGVLVATVKSMYWYRDSETKRKKFNTYDMHVLCATSVQETDKLWLGTDRKGLFEYDINKEKFTDSITINDNFTGEVIYGILPDKFKNLWVSTNHGLFQVCPNKKLINQYYKNDLKQVGEFHAGSFCTIQDSSTFYFGGIDGITSFTPKNIVENRIVEKPTLIISFDYPELGNKKLTYSKIPKEAIIKMPRIPSHFNYLSIEFTLPNYNDPFNNQFRVVLDQDTMFANNGRLILTESQFDRKIINCNILKVDYRSGSGEWTNGGTFKINRGFWTIELVILVWVSFVGYLLTFLIRRYNTNNFIRTQRRINEVARTETIDALKNMVKKHLINDFDYVIVSLVDFNQKRIISVDSACKNDSITNPEEWIKNSNYSLNSNDILSQIVNKKISTVVFKNEILNSEIKEEGALNSSINKDYKHDQLAKLYIPIIHKSKKSSPLDKVGIRSKSIESFVENKDIVMGVIEVGFIPKAYESFYPAIRKFIQWAFPENGYIARFLTPLEYLRHKEVQLKIYADNFAQPYYRAALKENRQNFYHEILDPYEEKETNHFKFIHSVLENVAKKIGADYGNIAFRSFNTDEINITNRRNVFYGKDYNHNTIKLMVQKNIIFNEEKKGLINHVVDTKTPYYCNDTFNDKYYIKLREDIRSELAVPMMDKYKVIYGVFILSSTKENFFNDILIETVKKVVDKATTSFLKKVESNTLTQLMTPFDIFSRSNDLIYKNAVETLKHYFYADYIGVWKRFREDENYSNENKSNIFILSDVTTDDLWKIFKKENYLITKLSDRVVKENIRQPIQLIEVEKYINREARIVKICDELAFKSYLVISIVVDGRIEAFFNIFSKRKIDQKELSQYSVEFLESFSNKINMTLQHAELISAFTNISESLSNQEVENSLNVIVEEAYDLLPSTNSVVLFPYRGKEITLEEVYAAGDLHEVDKKDKKKPANFANYVLENGTQWISSEEENNKKLFATKETRPDRLTFWEKNNIKSSAAVLLKYGNRPVGVMFFNYNEKKDFEKQNAKRIIQAFTNFATTALINEGVISKLTIDADKFEKQNSLLTKLKESIEKEKKAIEEEKMNVEEEKKEVELKFSKLNLRYDELLPQFAKSSYFRIMQGVNHDIRNFLLTLEIRLKKIDTLTNRKNDLQISNSVIETKKIINNIENLLDIFDPRRQNEKEVIFVNDTIKNVIYFYKQKDKKVEFEERYSEGLLGLLCYKFEFSMVIYNLIDNAIQALNSKGLIRILTKYDNDMFFIIIEDNGKGIDHDSLGKIFDLGFSNKKNGKGIGLYFVKETIEKSFKGRIIAESRKGKMTKFTISIPEHINYI